MPFNFEFLSTEISMSYKSQKFFTKIQLILAQNLLIKIDEER
jgi:hypothetical protein